MKKLQGITLLESLLALAIASSIVIFGIQQYSSFKRDRDVLALRYNVDLILQAMRDYYYANCANLTLGPTATYTPPNPFPITLKNELNPYLSSPLLPNPVIDPSFGDQGYAVQFNLKILTGRKESFCYYFPNTGQTSSNCATVDNNTAQIYLWVVQVMVKVNDPQMAIAYKGLANASCAIANPSAPDSAVDCDKEGVTSGMPAYLVWQYLPSSVSPTLNLRLWNAKQFNLQYTNDSSAELISADYAGTQYYLCGG
jgi:type II secretory pathway pseudopilin PulG